MQFIKELSDYNDHANNNVFVALIGYLPLHDYHKCLELWNKSEKVQDTGPPEPLSEKSAFLS